MIKKSEGLIVNFENIPVRRVWDAKKEKWFFTVVDVVAILTESSIPRRYWSQKTTPLTVEMVAGANEIPPLELTQVE